MVIDSVRLVGVLTTFRVPDKDNKGVWSLGCNETFPTFLHIAPLVQFFFNFLYQFFLSPPFFLIISVIALTPEPMFQLNVCSLGWVIDSNTVRSVVCVSLSFPESSNHWDHWQESPNSVGSNRWTDPPGRTVGRSESTQRSNPYTDEMPYFIVPPLRVNDSIP